MPRGIPNSNICSHCGEEIRKCKGNCKVGNGWHHTRAGHTDVKLHACWPLKTGTVAAPANANRGKAK